MQRLLYLIYSTVLLVGNYHIAATPTIDSQQPLLPQANPHDLSYNASQHTNAQHGRPKPFYVIAHRVLMAERVKEAVSHGANALEIDMTAWKNGGWYADHDGTLTSYGDTARKMFEAIADERKAGKTITFVWLDIKTPNLCDPAKPKERHCSIDALRDLAREILTPQGVSILYGFYKVAPLIPFLTSTRDNEAIDLNGETDVVASQFDYVGISTRSKRVLDYGIFDFLFGLESTARELAKAVASEKFGKVFRWTFLAKQSSYLDRLLGNANIDGLIYGFINTHYYGHFDTQMAAWEIHNWVFKHPNRYYIATQDDKPW